VSLSHLEYRKMVDQYGLKLFFVLIKSKPRRKRVMVHRTFRSAFSTYIFGLFLLALMGLSGFTANAQTGSVCRSFCDDLPGTSKVTAELANSNSVARELAERQSQKHSQTIANQASQRSNEQAAERLLQQRRAEQHVANQQRASAQSTAPQSATIDGSSAQLRSANVSNISPQSRADLGASIRRTDEQNLSQRAFNERQQNTVRVHESQRLDRVKLENTQRQNNAVQLQRKSEQDAFLTKQAEQRQHAAQNKQTNAQQQAQKAQADIEYRAQQNMAALKRFEQQELLKKINKTSNTPQSVHKNSRAYEGSTHVYAIRSPDGSIYKVGESAGGVRAADGSSKRANAQVNELNGQLGPGHTSRIRKTFDNKDQARHYETDVIERFRRKYGEEALLGNKTNR
jgi:hypothetical protein